MALADTPECAPPARELEDLTLRRAQRGERAALHAFIKMYEGRVHAVIGRLLPGRPERVEDLAQDSFIKALQALPRFDPQGRAKLSTWLITIAVRTTLDEHKRQRRPQPDLAVVVAAPPTPMQMVVAGELQRRVEAFLTTLEPSTRAVLVLRFFHELELAEIADALDLEVGTVKSRLGRARKRLAETLKATP